MAFHPGTLAAVASPCGERTSDDLLVVNGQVLSPGAELAPGLVLESVDAHSAVLHWNGTRFRVGY